jgi:hypothetical protein
VLAALAIAGLALQPQTEIVGAQPGDRVGAVVAHAGDLNGDGIADIALGLEHARPHGRRSGAVYVIYGSRKRSRVSLARLGSRGFRIDGAEREARTGTSVAAAGDFNGDGLDDLVVGAQGGVSGIDTVHGGAAYVVYGSRKRRNVDLREPGAAAMKLIDDGTSQLGFTVDGLGDFNGDGLDDVIVGNATDTAYVLFGSRRDEDVRTGDLSRRGFWIAWGGAGYAVAGVGDVNRDGYPDAAVVGAESHNAHIVYGGRSRKPVDLGRLGNRGVRVTGHDDIDTLAAVGDVDGDKRPDVLIGSSDLNTGWLFSRGTLGHTAYRLHGWNSVDGVGDLDGDRRADLVVGAPGRRGRDRGGAYIVTRTRTVHLPGPAPGARAGWSVAGVPRGGVLVGAPYYRNRRGIATLYR